MKAVLTADQKVKPSAHVRADALVALIAAMALLATTLPAVALPRLGIVTPISYFVAFIGEVATAVVLFSMSGSLYAHRSTVVLALAYAAGSVLLLLATLTLPMVRGEAPVIDAPAQAGFWFYAYWNALTAVGAMAYIRLRRFDGEGTVSRRFTQLAVASTALVIVVIAISIFAVGDRLPVLVQANSLAGWVRTGVGPALVVLLSTAAFFAFRMREPSSIDRALAYSLLAITLAITLSLVGGHRNTPTFYTGRLLLLFGTSFVFVAAMQSFTAARFRLGMVESTLQQTLTQSAKRVAHIRALWEMSSHVAQTRQKQLSEILTIATANVRSGKPMLGFLSHLEGHAIVVDAAASATVDRTGLLAAGFRIPFTQQLAALVKGAGRTLAWNDTTALEPALPLYQAFGFRSFIGTAVTIPERRYFVSFASLEPMSGEPFADDDIAYVEVVAAVIADRFNLQEQSERLQFQVEHDALTGLDNRVRFTEAVREQIQSSTGFAIAFIDIDGFTRINKREGHRFGDQLLAEVAAGLRLVANADVVARTSADEFGILVRDVASLEATVAALGAYGDIFTEPFHSSQGETRNLTITASIGAARYPADAATVEALMRRAEVALAVAKTRGGATTLVFDEPMESILEETEMRVAELAAGIARDELAVVYQPTYDIAKRAVFGAEALVRWDHPERGRLSPALFIPIAEDHGLIGALTRAVLQRIVRDVASVPQLPPGFRIYFNVAVQMLEDMSFIAELGETLHATPGLLEHIGIEVTESAAMQNVERSMRTLDIFRSWGLPVAIDDFGTGYSSLAYLKKLTADVIKIDRSFVAGLPDDEHDVAITEMLLKITERLHLVTLAEGVETEAQAAWLLERGCRLGQGYLFARPDSFAVLLERLSLPLREAS